MVVKQFTLSYQQYFTLLKAEAKLQYLEAMGVDNWSGYGCSCDETGEDSCIFCTEDTEAFLGLK